MATSRTCRWRVPALALGALLGLPPLAAAQEGEDPAAAPEAAPDAEDEPAFTQEQLEQMLAPIALYPDDLLSQVLMAATYPLEIVQADRWVKANPDLKDEAAALALEKEDWDASVKSLVAVPEVLALLSDELDWTQSLGDAFIGQQEQVLAAVQALRARAKEAGQLVSSEQQTVEVVTEGGTEIIVIESSEPDVIYVPVYDTTVVYGYWPYSYYPPYPYYPPAYRVGTAVLIGFAWGYAWGDCDWHGGDVDINIDRNLEINHHIDRDRYRRDNAGGRGAWTHAAAHRRNVPYRDQKTAKRFGGESAAQATAARESFRGRSDGGQPRVIKGGVEGGKPGAAADRGPTIKDRSTSGRTSTSRTTGTRTGALDSVDRGGREVRKESKRGQSSRARSPSRSASRAPVRAPSRGGGRGRR